MLLIVGIIILAFIAAGTWAVFGDDAGRNGKAADGATVISGTVMRGKQKGRTLDFPTVNIPLPIGKAASGVYAGKIDLDGKKYDASIFVGKSRNLLEAHILDFDGDLYGKKVEIEIGRKIREAMEFENDESMKEQIKSDIISIRNH